ncbi:Riboflavin biosynthesis protein [Anaerolineae bacterium]|nr:Riboflavin biosynthesis protein [Anaerolineae bacterium]
MAPGFLLEVNGIRIRTAEALYQACRFPRHPRIQRLIIQQRSPMTAKMESKPYRKDTRPDWDKVRVNIMRWCLRVKLVQNWEKFSALLLTTDDRPIVEESRKDDFWGAYAQGNETLVGVNVLGRLLMELREELRSPNREQLRRVEPLSIQQFLLYGKPIGVVEAHQHERAHDSNILARPIVVDTRQLDMAHSQVDLYHFVPNQKPEEAVEGRKTNDEIRSISVIPQECKRLAEVDFPIATVSKHAAREKSIRHGHPSTLHLWWARRPLASSRAMLLALLLPDPCDAECPADFKAAARDLLPQVVGTIGPADDDLRKALLKFIGDFADWNFSSEPKYLQAARGLVKAAHPEETPLVVDPFSGGGSIPLEALRLGCEAFASDLNPVAGLILKVMLEDIPRYGNTDFVVTNAEGEAITLHGLAEALRYQGKLIKAQAEQELAEFYPADPDGAKPIAYIWARTVRCESPNCGAEIPLMRSFWLSKKANRQTALHPLPDMKHKTVDFEIITKQNNEWVSRSNPKSKISNPKFDGTVARAKATCSCCGIVLSPDRVRAQLRDQNGGADVIFDASGKRIGGARLMAVVTLKSGEIGRQYRLPTDSDDAAVWKATQRMKEVAAQPLLNGLSAVPDEPLPPQGTLGFRVQLYGMTQWGNLFSARQQLALLTLSRLISVLKESSFLNLFGLVLDGVVDRNATLASWRPQADQEKVEHVFARQALPITWDFAEAMPLSESTGSFGDRVDTTASMVSAMSSYLVNSAQVGLADATESLLLDESASVWFTDPPYYDAVPYADLSDFFLVWLKRSLPNRPFLRDPFDPSNPLSPKLREAVQDEVKQVDGQPKDRQFFEETMAKAFAEGRRVLREDGIGSVVFAHKTTEGWEALLTGMIRGGWVITGSWPLATEMGTRLRARESAALATSVHLICRPRTTDDLGDWSDVLRELPKRVADWMERLQSEGVRGAVLVCACIGPALEIDSRYARVVDAEDREIPLGGDPEAKEPHRRGYLAYVWEVVGRTALEQVLGTAEAKARNGAVGALEEDARLTALFLWTLQSTTKDEGGRNAARGEDEEDDEVEDEEDETPRKKAKGGYSLVFDVARRFAQPLGIHLPDWEGRIIETEKGIVRLLAVSERAVQLFGEEGAQAVSDLPSPVDGRGAGGEGFQLALFPESTTEAVPVIKGRGKRKAAANVSDETLKAKREATTLDRVHAAMLLQQSGRANALRALLKTEQERGPNFLRLANSLSALYPRDSEEKRLLDAMLLAVPR